MLVNSRDTLIVGFPGRLARAFSRRWPKAKRVQKADFDITDRKATLRFIEKLQPKIVFNCAAVTDMTLCEKEPDLAWAVNVRGVRNLAEGCIRVGAVFVHFSSDYAIHPVNEYAWTKRSSESLADLTIRAKVYDESHWAWQALLNQAKVQMLTNEYLNPISTSGLALILEKLLQRGSRGLVGVGTRDRLNFWEVGRTWAEFLGVNPEFVEPVDRLNNSLSRMPEMYIDTQNIVALGVSVPTLAEDVQRHLEFIAGNGVSYG